MVLTFDHITAVAILVAGDETVQAGAAHLADYRYLPILFFT